MNLEKLKPWNWFKHEEHNESHIPVTKHEAKEEAERSANSPEVTHSANPSEVPVVNPSTAPLLQLHQEMDRLFDDVWRSFGLSSPSRLFRQPSLFGSGLHGRGLHGRGPHGRDSYSGGLLGSNVLNSSLAGDFRANLDISGTDKEYEVSIDLPGMSDSDIQIDVTGNVMTIRGEKEETNENKEKQYYRVERSYGAFQRTLSLPDDANKDDISATMKDGVLTVRIPRLALPKEEVKRISISS